MVTTSRDCGSRRGIGDTVDDAEAGVVGEERVEARLPFTRKALDRDRPDDLLDLLSEIGQGVVMLLKERIGVVALVEVGEPGDIRIAGSEVALLRRLGCQGGSREKQRDQEKSHASLPRAVCAAAPGVGADCRNAALYIGTLPQSGLSRYTLRDGRLGRNRVTIEASAREPPLLETRHLTKSFRSLVALRSHDITVREGEIVGVIGPNGSGKSTFFNVVSGFQRPDRGTVLFQGRAIERQPAADIVRLGIARTFQGTRLFQRLTVAENVRAAAQLRHSSGMFDALLGTARLKHAEQEVDGIVDELLDLVHLGRRADTRASELAYGDQRRLELVRALATRPRLLMLDEPAAGMDASETRGVLKLIEDIRGRYGLAVIVVEHDMDLIMNLCERIQVLAHGERIFEGTPAEVQANARVREVYLGHA